jgi:hypothetical protein
MADLIAEGHSDPAVLRELYEGHIRVRRASTVADIQARQGERRVDCRYKRQTPRRLDLWSCLLQTSFALGNPDGAVRQRPNRSGSAKRFGKPREVSGERRGHTTTLFVVGNWKLATSDRQSASELSGLPEPGLPVLSVRKFPFLEVPPYMATKSMSCFLQAPGWQHVLI